MKSVLMFMGQRPDLNNMLPPLIFPGDSAKERKRMTALKEHGFIRPIGPRLYTSVPEDQVESVVRNSWGLIVSTLFPNALISHVTALTYQPNAKNEIYLTSSTNRDINLPGLTIRFMRGKGAIETDLDFMGMKASSFERALLENLSASKGSIASRALGRNEVHLRLKLILERKGVDGLKSFNQQVHAISEELKLEVEYRRFKKIVKDLIGEKQSEEGLLRGNSLPYDPQCFGRLELLFSHLRHLPLKEIKETNRLNDHFNNKAFFEAFFSNSIEGSRLNLEQAEKVVFQKALPEGASSDEREIFNTFRLLSNPNEIRKTPKSPEDFETLLRSRHRFIFETNSDVGPGVFKTKVNQARSTSFVEPQLVRGTLRRGFDLYNSLPVGLPRAIFMMFLVLEVHPFADGNGRLARVMMNAELAAEDLSTIIIPQVFKDSYFDALRALSKKNDPTTITNVISEAHQFSKLNFSSYRAILDVVQRNNWFCDPTEAIIRL